MGNEVRLGEIEARLKELKEENDFYIEQMPAYGENMPLVTLLTNNI